MINKSLLSNKWFVLAVATLTLAGGVGIPFTAMPVLFSDITAELHLSLSQIGLIWGAMPLGVAFFSYPGGLVGDRFGFRKVVGVSCVAVAVISGLRGISNDAVTLTAFMFLCGIVTGFVVPNIPKTAGIYFPRKQLGLAIGIINSGFNVGSILATALGASFFLPLLGSWRNVLFLYGGIGVLLSIVWMVLVREKEEGQKPITDLLTAERRVPFRESLSVTLRVRDIWLLVIAGIGVLGSFLSIVGYVPLYLEAAGMSKSAGDAISSTIFVAGIAGTILVPTLSDKLGTRKKVVIGSTLVMGAAVLLMAFAGQSFAWLLLPVIGATAMGMGTLCITIPFEMEEIGPIYGASAIGIVIAAHNFGGFLLPVIGGKIAEANPSWAFIFWACLVFAAVICLLLIRETGSKSNTI